MLESRRRLLNTLLMAILTLSGCLLATSLFLVRTPCVGFNAVLTAVLHLAYAAGAIITLNKSPGAYQIGILVGASLMVLVLSGEGAIFWALHARDNALGRMSGYVAATIHTIILAVQLAVTWIIVQAKEDVIDTYAAYEYIPDVTYADRGVLSDSLPLDFQMAGPTADI